MVITHTSMKIHIVKSYEHKGDQQYIMVDYCQYYWYRLNNADYQSYQEIMNMETCRWDNKYYVAETYHFNLNKW